MARAQVGRAELKRVGVSMGSAELKRVGMSMGSAELKRVGVSMGSAAVRTRHTLTNRSRGERDLRGSKPNYKNSNGI